MPTEQFIRTMRAEQFAFDIAGGDTTPAVQSEYGAIRHTRGGGPRVGLGSHQLGQIRNQGLTSMAYRRSMDG